METANNVINLETFRVVQGNKISKVFTGRDRGKFVREKSKLDSIEQNNDIVEIIIPDNIYSINPSFFEELFVNVVKKQLKKVLWLKLTNVLIQMIFLI